MRISRALSFTIVVGVLGMAGAAAAFDLKNLSDETPPNDAFKFGITSYRAGDAQSAVEALSYAARKGNMGARWKLGRMYAEGDGVERDEVRAYELLNEVANSGIGDDDLRRPRSRPYVLDALVRVGTFFTRGIPNSDIGVDMTQARAYYERAAAFGNADAQYRLAQMYYRGDGGARSPHRAAKWAKLAMDKGHNGARALLGHLLFEGEGVTRQPLRGLTFLTIAVRLDSGHNDIRRMHENARSVATEAVWAQARNDAEDWLADNAPRATADLAPLTQ